MRELLGRTEPRIFTPPKRELTPQTSHGFAAIAFAEQMLKMKLFPWQEWLLIHGLELNEDETYRWRTIVVEVARQAGKTAVEIVLALWHMYALKSRTIVGTAQNLDNATKAWKEAVALARADEELAELIPEDGVYLGHPKQFVIVHNDEELETTSEYRVTADARGFSGDLLLLDELREQKTWDDWAAITNTMNARPKAQAWCFSNAPGPEGIVLRYLRALAHKQLGWPDNNGDSLGAILGEIEDMPEFEDMPEVDFATGFFEWSMPPGVPRNHPEYLMYANPSCNHTEITPNCITYRALIHGLRTSPAHVAEAEICCRETTLGIGGPWPEGSWMSTSDPNARPAPNAKIAVCVEISNKREHAYAARAGLTANGMAVVGIHQDRPGTDWIIDYLLETRKTYGAVVVRSGSASPIATLLDAMKAAKIPVTEWRGVEIPAAHGQMFDRLQDSTPENPKIAHLPHLALDTAATSASERALPGGGFVIDHAKSPCDTAPLFAAIGAVWGLGHLPSVPRVHGWDVEKLMEMKS